MTGGQDTVTIRDHFDLSHQKEIMEIYKNNELT